MPPKDDELGQPVARSTTEMLFAASLLPCPQCGARVDTRLDLFGGGTTWSLVGTCPSCKRRRTHTWSTEGHPNQAAVRPHRLGDARPSRIISVRQFHDELERLGPALLEPATLDVAPWRASLAAVLRAMTCVYELLEFVPEGADEISVAHAPPEEEIPRERLRRAWLRDELERLDALLDRYGKDAPRIWELERQHAPPPPLGRIDRESLRDHEAWLRGGRSGAGRLEVRGFDGRSLRLAGAWLEASRLEQVDFDGAVLEGARLQHAELVDVSAVRARATSLQLAHAHIEGGSFQECALALAVFDGARLDKTDFESAWLDRSSWRDARICDARFGSAMLRDASFAGAHFLRCSMRGADFSLRTPGIRVKNQDAIFENCDLSLTSWQGRDLTRVTFLRCQR